VLLPLQVAKIMPYVMIGLGALLLIITAIIVIIRRSNTRRTKSSASGEGMNSY
jgi:nitrate reductase gamma subunit